MSLKPIFDINNKSVETVDKNFKLHVDLDNIKVHELDKKEPLLIEDEDRFTIFPIKHPSLYDFYKKHESMIWHETEVKLEQDVDHWNSLTKNEQFFIEMMLAFFASSDVIVGTNLASRFLNEIKVMEAQFFYTFQAMMENIHCVSYDTMILTDTGYYQISHLENKSVKIWNGFDFSSVVVKKTSEVPVNVLKVTLSDGSMIEATTDHKWLIVGSEERKMTKELKPSDKITIHSLPIIYNGKKLKDPYKCGSSFAMNKVLDAKQYFHDVPLSYNLESRLKWLAGYLDVIRFAYFEKQTDLQWNVYDNIKNLRKIQLLFTTFGERVKISEIDEPCLIVTLKTMSNLKKIGFDSEKFKIEIKGVIQDDENTLIIDKIQDENKQVITYCFDEKKNHTGIFNGIFTGQSEVYSKLIDVYVKEPKRKKFLFDAVKNIPAVKKKAQWAMKWINSNERFAVRLLAFAIYEGLFFQGGFASIFWMAERGKLPGLCKGNEFISKDEGVHTDFAVHLYTKFIVNKLTSEEFNKIMSEALEIEKEFITESIPCKLIGINADSMNNYIRYCANRLTKSLGHDCMVQEVPNPFPFMERIALQTKSNFFENDSASYKKEVKTVDTKDAYDDLF